MVERVPEFLGTRPKPDFFWATQTWLFQVGYVPEPDLMKQNIKFGVKRTWYPTKYPTFWVPEPDFLEFPPDPNPTFYYPIYSIPNFLLPAPPLLLLSIFWKLLPKLKMFLSLFWKVSREVSSVCLLFVFDTRASRPAFYGPAAAERREHSVVP